LRPRLLLDTHILVWWLALPKKLSREQLRVMRDAMHRNEALAISAITLLEMAVLFGPGSIRSAIPLEQLLGELEASPVFEILPLTISIAAEVAAIGASLRDPADRTIVATARVHKLKLVTSDERIIESKLVSVIPG
jgi:PIN domain nuclease of toxin-antitoxin system